MSISSPLSLPKIIAHRGASDYAPENTLASLQKAAELGADWIEFDVMLTEDGEAIVFHDETLDRTTNGSGLVAETTYPQISTLDAGSWFSPAFAEEKVPTFIAYLYYAAKLGLGINVEIKPTPGQAQKTAEKVVEILEHHWPDTALPPLVSSFSIVALTTVRALDKQLQLGLLLDEWFDGWKETAARLNCVSVNVDQALLNAEKVQEIKSCVPYALAYTVNDEKRALELFAMGVDAVFSNAPLQSVILRQPVIPWKV
jgi:glycerophosphoryl diester phosphodiesterase